MNIAGASALCPAIEARYTTGALPRCHGVAARDSAMEDLAFRRAVAALQTGDLFDAERFLSAVLEAKPDHLGALNLLSVVLTQRGQFAKAEGYLQRVLEQQPHSEVTLYNYGLVLKALERPVEALKFFTQALALNAAVAETWNNRGTVFNDLNRFEEAIEDFDKAVAIDPRQASALCNKGKSLTMLDRYEEALAAFDRALVLKPQLAEAMLGRANTYLKLQRYDDALADYDRGLTVRSDLAAAWLGRGNVCRALDRYDEAAVAYDRALKLEPGLAQARLARGIVSFRLRRYSEAAVVFEEALALKPDLAEAWLGRGNVECELKRYEESLAAFERALALKPDLAEAWLGRGNVLYEMLHNGGGLSGGDGLSDVSQYEDISASFDWALSLKADLAEAWLGRGNVLIDLSNHQGAQFAFDTALALKPDLAEAWLGRGNVLAAFTNYHDAHLAYGRALALEPDFAKAWVGQGDALAELKQYADAIGAYDRALSLKSDLKYTRGRRLLAQMQLADWTNQDAEISVIVSEVRQQKPVIDPFSFIAISSSASDQLRCAECLVGNQLSFPAIWSGEVYSHDRIRLAYLSSEFRDHAVAYLTAGLFEHHDRSRFEVTAISFEPGRDTEFCRRIRGAFERFVDVSMQTDQEIANLIRQLEIDIAVDLNGFTRNARLGVFARRAAPIQINYLGYAATMGADYYDYIIADRTVIPPEHVEFYSEKVAWLPDSFLANDAARPIAERTPSRGELGLPDQGFVFCCFNQSFKIGPAIFDIWMRLLREVDGSVLWLKENDAVATRNLRREAERRGVAPERLVFAPPVPLVTEHLARHRQADLFLDTLRYNAHTTASDALWAGLPVVTCLGSTFAGRVGASLLQAVGLSELVTTSLADYESSALKLATDPARLQELRERLARNRTTHPLFDTERFTRHIEAAYTMMWQRYQRGEAPKGFTVDRIGRAAREPLFVLH